MFMRLMEMVTQGLSYEPCLVHLDDIIIVECMFEDRLSNIRKVLEKKKNDQPEAKSCQM